MDYITIVVQVIWDDLTNLDRPYPNGWMIWQSLSYNASGIL